jgi:type II secretory pathway pseudopilin PulG
MNPAHHPCRAGARRRRSRAAFSLIEIMLAVGLMGVIIFALYGMFHYTQKALRSNVAQVDTLEGGRAAIELVTRDLALMSPSRLAGGTNLLVALSGYPPVLQSLVVTNGLRTNVLAEVYFLSRVNADIVATAYRVISATNGVGTLARFYTNLPKAALGWSNAVVVGPNRTTNLVDLVLARPAADFVPLADGVIHFRLRTYDQEGFPMEWQTAPRYTNLFRYTNVYLGTNLFLRRDPFVGTETRSAFVSNLLPAYVEVELGVLEPNTINQMQAIPTNLISGFLGRHAGQVHLFRERVPIRQSPPIRTAVP